MELQEVEFYDLYRLSIIKAYGDRTDLVNTINRLVPGRMAIKPGTPVPAMVLDVLPGRHPLYHYHQIDLSIVERSRYVHERPKADDTRTLKEMRYEIRANFRQNPEAVEMARRQARCFALISNAPPQGPPNAHTP